MCALINDPESEPRVWGQVWPVSAARPEKLLQGPPRRGCASAGAHGYP